MNEALTEFSRKGAKTLKGGKISPAETLRHGEQNAG